MEMTMAEENVFIKKLIEAREHEIEQRRYVAAELAEGYKRDHTEKMRAALISIQKTIEAIDRALQDEKGLAAPLSHPEGQNQEAEVEEGGPLLQ
jgi:hypothetical protein